MTKRLPRAEIYQDKSGGWRWRLISNGRNMANGSEAYASKSNARRAFRRVRFLLAWSRVER